MSVIESLNTFKQLASVKLVSTSNLTAAYYNGPVNNGLMSTLTFPLGTLSIDGVAVNLNDYVLLTAQSDGSQNGIYQCVVQGLSGVSAVLQRRGDFQCIEQIRGGQYVPVSQGAVFAGSMWTLVAPFPLYIGYSVSGLNNINFLNVSEGSAGGPFLRIANNLSDVASVPTSRVNLSVPATSTFAGNPNSNVGGILGDFVLDTANDTLWVNTTAGNAASAVWTSVESVSALNFPGNPNTHVAGTTYDLLWDTVDNLMWVCTTSGNAAAAVWTPTGAIVGTTTNNNATAGFVGEYHQSQILEVSAVPIPDNTPTNLTSLSVPAGDWMIGGNINFIVSGTTSAAYQGWINNVSATGPDSSLTASITSASDDFGTCGFVVPTQRFSLASTTTIYLTGLALFSGSSIAMNGLLYARRMR